MSIQSDKNPLDSSYSAEEQGDEYELYYGENAQQDIEEQNNRTPGPISRRPSLYSMIPSLIFLLLCFAVSSAYWYGSHGDMLWASHEMVFSKDEYWRLLTSILTHADIEHLLSNAPLLFFFGLFLFEYFGFLLFPVLSLLIGIFSSLLTLYFYNDTTRLIGASGMAYGMVSLWLVLYIYHDTDYNVPVRIFRSIGFALIMLFPTTYSPSTSYLAHAAGFFIGIISAIIILPFTNVKKKP